MRMTKAYAVVNEYGDILVQSGVHFWVFNDFETAANLKIKLNKNSDRNYFVKRVSIEEFLRCGKKNAIIRGY